MKVTFLLPSSSHLPVGGDKVVYEYSNALVARGHDVTVINTANRFYEDVSPARLASRWAVFFGRAIGLKGGYGPHSWFKVDPKVKILWTPSLDAKWVPDADVVVATAWETSEWVARYPKQKGQKYYLIQHDESLFDGVCPERVKATWKLPLTKIVIARWLQAIARDLGEESHYIPNGLDFKAFGLDTPAAERDPFHIIMLYHTHTWKGTADGLKALIEAKKQFPHLKATFFGYPAASGVLPDWITYVQRPDQVTLRQLYNSASIFLGPSFAEGWPLPPAEAMQCAAATCLTDIGGHSEYALDGETSLLSPPRDYSALSTNLSRFLNDNDFRCRLAMNGHAHIQQFTWKRATDSLEQVIFGDRTAATALEDSFVL